jgi:hypothetical protein
MAKITQSEIAQKVRESIRDRHPGGVTLEVVEQGIRKVDYWWRVPVRPSAWPEKMFEYYEALAEVESEIQEKEHLNILLSTSEPSEASLAGGGSAR